MHERTKNVLFQAEQKKRKIWKLVLTGGPCGGKTTGQARLSTFFENLGWKVYRYMYLVNKYCGMLDGARVQRSAARGSFVCDIPAGDGITANPF